MTTLPWPPDWRRPPLGGWLGVVVFGAVAAFLVLAAAIAATGRQWVAVAVIGGVLLVLAPIAAASRPRRPAFATEVSLDLDGRRQTGVRFPVLPTSPLVSLALAVLGLAILGLGVAALVIAVADGDWSAVVGFVVLLLVGSVLALGGIVGLIASRRRLGLDLTPSHLVVGLGGDPVELTWEQVDRIGTTSIRYGFGLAPVQNWLTVVTREPVHVATGPPGRRAGSAGRRVGPSGRRAAALGRLTATAPANTAAAIPAQRLGADPVLVYHALRYYLEHADARPELGTGAALRRLAAGELVR
ncbi:hypothetical protein [Jiangella alba]|uniref:PH domain-containing protein n=1 Tax=Jiangella alba TaxID=561176 RepID=A0A1H5DZU1_9ACTN|nr:hypothetical protein [Jiangella alba]SED84362.1 hypothetical protein SAMN04488561_0575 [Jiangella alba]